MIFFVFFANAYSDAIQEDAFDIEGHYVCREQGWRRSSYRAPFLIPLSEQDFLCTHGTEIVNTHDLTLVDENIREWRVPMHSHRRQYNGLSIRKHAPGILFPVNH